MTLSSDRLKAMTFSHPQYIPVTVNEVPAVWMHYREEYAALKRRHPLIFGEQPYIPEDFDNISYYRYRRGEYVDNWGCGWSNVRDGFDAIVTGHPLPQREMIRSFHAPETLEGSLPHGFMFLRLTDLRGYEEAMIDFAEEPEELQMLIDIVLEHNMREIDVMVQTCEEIMYFGDDLGMQTSLPTGPVKWRKYLKPCYMRMYKYVRQAGKYVYMHTDGHIFEIIPDLVECGVNVINPQIRANGLDNLARVCKGQVCVDIDLDRQLFPFCTPQDVDEHIHEVVATLGSPEGGLWLQAEIGPDYPLENIEAICVAMEKYRGYFSETAG